MKSDYFDLYRSLPDGNLVSLVPSDDVLDFISSFPLGLRTSVCFPRVVVLRMSFPAGSLTSPLTGCSARAEALRKKRADTSNRMGFILESPPDEVGNEMMESVSL